MVAGLKYHIVARMRGAKDGQVGTYDFVVWRKLEAYGGGYELITFDVVDIKLDLLGMEE